MNNQDQDDRPCGSVRQFLVSTGLPRRRKRSSASFEAEKDCGEDSMSALLDSRTVDRVVPTLKNEHVEDVIGTIIRAHRAKAGNYDRAGSLYKIYESWASEDGNEPSCVQLTHTAQ